MKYDKELVVALDLARKAGEAIMPFFKMKNEIKIKADGSAVTKADMESENIILNGIRQNFPSDAIVSEETIKTRGTREWHIDPLDGTAAFILQENTFTVHIGLSVNGRSILGVIFKPATNEMYYGVERNKAYKLDSSGNKSILYVDEPDLNNMVAVTTFNNKAKSKIELFVKTLGIKELIKIGGTGQKVLMIAENEADIFPIVLTETCVWDLCAPQAILEAAGGIAEYMDGQSISYEKIIKIPKGVLIGKSREQIDFIRERTLNLFR